MSRVSQEELYNDKDVVTQILKLKDTVNDYAGGIIENIDVSGNDLVIDWADGTNVSLPLPSPTGISSVTGAVSGGNLTITFYMTDGSSHAFTCPLTGMATEAYVNGLDAQNVKLTGAQSVAGVKTFTDSPVVPDSPATEHSAVAQTWAENVVYPDETVNNLLHKEGNEVKIGQTACTADRPYIIAGNWVDTDTATGYYYKDIVTLVDSQQDKFTPTRATATLRFAMVGNIRQVELLLYDPVTNTVKSTILLQN